MMKLFKLLKCQTSENSHLAIFKTVFLVDTLSQVFSLALFPRQISLDIQVLITLSKQLKDLNIFKVDVSKYVGVNI